LAAISHPVWLLDRILFFPFRLARPPQATYCDHRDSDASRYLSLFFAEEKITEPALVSRCRDRHVTRAPPSPPATARSWHAATLNQYLTFMLKSGPDGIKVANFSRQIIESPEPHRASQDSFSSAEAIGRPPEAFFLVLESRKGGADSFSSHVVSQSFQNPLKRSGAKAV
jgi:hypothetical protein